MTPLVDAGGKEIPPTGIPVTSESMGGSLIDSARITVIAAIGMLPEFVPLVTEADEHAPPSLHECLEQAMSWLDAARAITVEMGAPVTSLHVVKKP